MIKPDTSFNVKDLFNIVEEERQEIALSKELASDDFGFEDVKTYWNEFLTQLKSENKPATFNALQSVKISMDRENQIDIRFYSLSIEQEFEQVRERLILFLRERLNNHLFEVITSLIEEEAENLIKSKAEIFKEMVTQNPLLLNLKNELGLDYNSDE